MSNVKPVETGLRSRQRPQPSLKEMLGEVWKERALASPLHLARWAISISHGTERNCVAVAGDGEER